MITVKEYRGHIRNWKALCEELNIDTGLGREESYLLYTSDAADEL